MRIAGLAGASPIASCRSYAALVCLWLLIRPGIAGVPPTVRSVFVERVRDGLRDVYPFRELPHGRSNVSSVVELRLDESLSVVLRRGPRYDRLLVLSYEASRHPDERRLRLDDPREERGCYYTGKVKGEARSHVVVSLCRGMLGYIQSSSAGLLTVEPQGDVTSPRPAHLLRRLSAANGTFGGRERAFRSRRKRSYSVERHVEVLVAVDSKMALYHGEGLEHYVLTLMTAVAHIYRDPSIGNLLNIAVVKLVVMQGDEDGKMISRSASDTLKNFCRWQHGHNHEDDGHPYHHDTAILLTREDLCRLPRTCDTLGLAQSGMICDPYSSCAIVEDNGLSAAFTIAHELGHVLNVPHDDDEKCARHRPTGQWLHVMARMLDYNSHPWSWSPCSRHYITAFLDAGYGRCLRDVPLENLLAGRAGERPGELFNMDEQCELVFGPGAKICPYMPVCKRLWCTVQGHGEGGCRTQHMPWADGTPCGLRQWCQKGRCMPVTERTNRRPVDGEWGPWEEYSPCSRSCGGGVESSSRECDDPRPSFGGRYCVGERVRYRSCNTQPCPVGSRDFREEQCSTFDGKTLDFPDVPSGSRWTAHYAGIAAADSCKLYCRVLGSGAYYLLKERVVDGTPCNPESFDVCIGGSCKPAGCDLRLNSTVTTDSCGVCGGDNSTCRAVKGRFSRARFGYNLVAKIPAGASYVDIRQYGFEKDDNYLALRDSNEEFLLNGNFTVSVFRKTLRYGGTVIEYSGSNASVERINATRPLGRELQLLVLTVGNVESPDIRYEYVVSVRNEELHGERYVWELEDEWSPCSRACQGRRERAPVCRRLPDGARAAEERCDPEHVPPALVEACNVHCTLHWQTSEPSECSARCGTGVRTRAVRCMQTFEDGQETKVEDDLCAHLGPRPPEGEKCGAPCFRWDYDDWQPCSKSCGGGEQIRKAVCTGEDGESGPDEDRCDAAERRDRRPCNLLECPRWQVGPWTECSVSCGEGLRRRPLWCQHEEYKVAGSFCHPARRPPDSEPCRGLPCPQGVASWGSSPCSRSCGSGLQRRQVACKDGSTCPPGEKPAETRICRATQECPQWVSGPWTKCDAECGGGKQKRRVSCQDEAGFPLPVAHCQRPRPVDERPCNVGDCASPSKHRWNAGPWSSCSVTCGEGVRRRTVECLDERQRTLPHERCEEAPPEPASRCRLPDCPRWQLSPLSPCSAPCGNGTQKRVARCVRRGREVSADLCDGDRPRMQVRVCLLRPCHYYWKKKQWSPCSATCGGGSQMRKVTCVDRGGRPASERWCGTHRRPRTVRRCASEPCPFVWRTSDWSECSRTCGTGVQKRTVSCHRVNAHGWLDPAELDRVRGGEYCSPEARPAARRSCHVGRCEDGAFWRPGPWSACSVPCGPGRQKRRLRCYDPGGKRIHNSRCSGQLKRRLKRKRKCHLRPCGALGCRELQERMGIRTDGEREVYVRGRRVTLYCGRMNTSQPQEYVSLGGGDSSNYSEVYGKRLTSPDTCPYGGARVDYCDCLEDYPAGLTTFSKVAINVSSLRVELHDLTYSRTLHGRPVGFAESGDCYSRVHCPQGRFSLSLAGTGFVVAPGTRWVVRGAHTAIDVRRLQGGELIQGRCGGYCGKCFPDPTTGLVLDVRPP